MANEYNIEHVYQGFSNVIDPSDNRSVRVREFVIAFRELAKFFDHLNIVFQFVAKDLVDKFEMLESCHRNDPNKYHSVDSMIEHERNLSDRAGTVAMLRLLRALEFTYLFLQRSVVSPEGSASTKQVAWNVYKETLSKRHNRAIQASVWAATATIPKRESLRKILIRGEVGSNTAEKCFPLIEKVYLSVRQSYAENDLLELVHL